MTPYKGLRLRITHKLQIGEKISSDTIRNLEIGHFRPFFTIFEKSTISAKMAEIVDFPKIVKK